MEKHIKLATLGEITDPIEFEKHCGSLMIAAGFKDVHVTQASSDFGVDILANDGKASIAVQCKLYSDPVGVHAIQEVVSGKCYYKCDKSAVITNSTFTPQAIELAKSTETILWDKTQVMKWELNYINLLKNQPHVPQNESHGSTQQYNSEVDDMLPQAIQMAVENGYISTSMLQRKLRLVYTRAGRIMDMMEQRGIIGPSQGSKPRDVLITRQQWLEMSKNK